MHRAQVWLPIAIVVGCSGGNTPVELDASSDAPTDASAAIDAPLALDGPPMTTCQAGGNSTVMVDLGTNALPLHYSSAWWNRGNASKACWKINVVLSTQAVLTDPYLFDPNAIELSFGAVPVIGVNAVQVHVHSPDRYFAGVVTLSTTPDADVVGTIDAADSLLTVTGMFTAARCEAIFDPCI
jgi:hypothetical protein